MGRPQYSYNESAHEYPAALDYHNSRSQAAFQQNSNLPGFSAAIASTAPPLPISQPWESHAYAPSTTTQDDAFYPSNMAGASGMYINPNRPLRSTPSHLDEASRAPAAEEGELSEGEFEDIYSNDNVTATPTRGLILYENRENLDDYNTYHPSPQAEYMTDVAEPPTGNCASSIESTSTDK